MTFGAINFMMLEKDIDVLKFFVSYSVFCRVFKEYLITLNHAFFFELLTSQKGFLNTE